MRKPPLAPLLAGVRLVGNAGLACLALLGAPSATWTAEVGLTPHGGAPVLALSFDALPAWRRGPLPRAAAGSIGDADLVLVAGLTSGVRPPFDKTNNSNAAWSSLPHEQEAYPNADAMAALGISPYAVRGGALLITASPMPAAAAATLPRDMPRRYLSGAFNTFPFSQTFGYFEVTARVPHGAGLWPAFWLLPTDGSWPPEIDIAEVLGNDTRTTYASLHSTDVAWVHREPHSYNNSTTTDPATGMGDLSEGFHRYALDWQPNTIIFLLDDRIVARRTTPPDMHKPFYLVVNLAVGDAGSWAGPPDKQTEFPATLEIRSVKIWKQELR